VFRVEPADPAHDQPGGDVLGLAAAGEGGEADLGDPLGDLGVGDAPLLGLDLDRVRIPDRHPGGVGDAGDCGGDGRGRAATPIASNPYSMDKIERLVTQTRARVVRQHVPHDFASLPRFPEPLR